MKNEVIVTWVNHLAPKDAYAAWQSAGFDYWKTRHVLALNGHSCTALLYVFILLLPL